VKKKLLIVFGAVFLVVAVATVGFAAIPIKLIVNGQEIKADVPAQLISGRTMVPVRWVAEALGANVEWDAKSNSVKIDTKGITQDYINKTPSTLLPSGGSISMGWLTRQNRNVISAYAALNSYLAKKQTESLSTNNILMRYEIIDAGVLGGYMDFTNQSAIEMSARLYYSQLPNNQDASVLEFGPGTTNIKPESNYYEDAIFIVQPIGGTVVENNMKNATMGIKGWEINEGKTEIVNKQDILEVPILFDLPLPQ